MKMRHVRPQKLTANSVIKHFGRHWTCPYCKVENTNVTPDEDIGWVYSTVRRREPKYICLGCCEDIYSTCAADDFESHLYLDIVTEAAKEEGITVERFRIECLEQQLRCALERREEEKTEKYNSRISVLQELIKSLAK